MTATRDVFDFYEIVGPAGGFYVGQAKRDGAGWGWRRRVREHRTGRGSKSAMRLLAEGGVARTLGAVACTPEFALALEARAWDLRHRRGQSPAHERPWGAGMPARQVRQVSAIVAARRQEHREIVWERSGGRCERCGKEVNRVEWEAHVHHAIYRGRGRERLEDLTLLCLACHGAEHPGRVFLTRVEQEARRDARRVRRAANQKRRGQK